MLEVWCSLTSRLGAQGEGLKETEEEKAVKGRALFEVGWDGSLAVPCFLPEMK